MLSAPSPLYKVSDVTQLTGGGPSLLGHKCDLVVWTLKANYQEIVQCNPLRRHTLGPEEFDPHKWEMLWKAILNYQIQMNISKLAKLIL